MKIRAAIWTPKSITIRWLARSLIMLLILEQAIQLVSLAEEKGVLPCN